MFDQTQSQPISVDLRRHHFLTAKKLENALHLRRRNAQSALSEISIPNLFAIKLPSLIRRSARSSGWRR